MKESDTLRPRLRVENSVPSHGRRPKNKNKAVGPEELDLMHEVLVSL
jgi:hypothetical protein